MELKDRIAAVMEASSMKAPTFAKFLGLKTAQGVYDILHGKTKTLSSDMLFKIMSCFPNISQDWLITGEGEMFRSSVSQTSTGDNNTQVAGNGNNVVTSSKNPSDLVEKLVSENIELRKELSKQMQASNENISRLISLLEAERGINNSTTEN